MTKIKLPKSVVDAAKAQTSDFELRDTIVPGFICKVTPTGRKVFMLQYRTNSGMRRKPELGQFGELTVEPARSPAQDWPAFEECATGFVHDEELGWLVESDMAGGDFTVQAMKTLQLDLRAEFQARRF
ncbi:integrase [Cupriavidus sp. SK-4]|nr:integrase [Cupriavidus sp. SK-4]